VARGCSRSAGVGRNGGSGQVVASLLSHMIVTAAIWFPGGSWESTPGGDGCRSCGSFGSDRRIGGVPSGEAPCGYSELLVPRQWLGSVPGRRRRVTRGSRRRRKGASCTQRVSGPWIRKINDSQVAAGINFRQAAAGKRPADAQGDSEDSWLAAAAEMSLTGSSGQGCGASGSGGRRIRFVGGAVARSTRSEQRWRTDRSPSDPVALRSVSAAQPSWLAGVWPLSEPRWRTDRSPLDPAALCGVSVAQPSWLARG
jgi:hypothetical protein